jgi:predicted phage terminase large subunit-like protein
MPRPLKELVNTTITPIPTAPPQFTAEEIDLLLQNLNSYTPDEQAEILRIVEELEARQRAEAAYNDLIEFCKQMQTDYKVGKHHRILADMLMDIERGKEYGPDGEDVEGTGKDRICVNMPPRHGKSQLISIYFPAWFLGRNPDKKVLMVSHTTDLAVDFGRKVRNLIATPEYQAIFPTVQLASDSKSAGRWNTSAGGEYFACGVGSALAGRGAHLLLVDDPHNEQDIISGNLDVFDKAYEWFTFGARTRLMPGGRIAIVQTRWHLDDLTGRVVRDMAQNELADKYEVVEFPAILEVESEVPDPKNRLLTIHKTIEKPLWPEFFNLDALYRTKASMPVFQWNAQYQQKPTAEEAAMVKREWWKEWPHEDPPSCEYIIMTLDAAAEKNNRADFTALTTWGVFFHEEENCYCIILLNSIKKRLEFPELKELAMEQYEEWEPDAFIVEKKSSGTPLYQEMRRSGLMVQEYTPHRGSGDKTARLNSVADIVRSGLVYVPQTRWAEELVEEVAGFPFMSNDDLVDTTIMALMRFRQGGFISLPTDEAESESLYRRRGGFY